MKFHVNPETGNTGPCTATVQCRFGDSPHFDTAEQARQAYEQSQYTFPVALLDEVIDEALGEGLMGTDEPALTDEMMQEMDSSSSPTEIVANPDGSQSLLINGKPSFNSTSRALVATANRIARAGFFPPNGIDEKSTENVHRYLGKTVADLQSMISPTPIPNIYRSETGRVDSGVQMLLNRKRGEMRLALAVLEKEESDEQANVRAALGLNAAKPRRVDIFPDDEGYEVRVENYGEVHVNDYEEAQAVERAVAAGQWDEFETWDEMPERKIQSLSRYLDSSPKELTSLQNANSEALRALGADDDLSTSSKRFNLQLDAALITMAQNTFDHEYDTPPF